MFLRSLLIAAATLALAAEAQAGFVFSVANVSDIMQGQTNTITIRVAWDGVGANNLQAPGMGTLRLALRQNNSSSGAVNVSGDSAIVVDPAFDTGGYAGVASAMTGYTNIVSTNRKGIVASDVTGGITTTGTNPIDLGTYTLTGQTVGSVTLRVGYDLYNGGNFGTPAGVRFNDFAGANLTAQLPFFDFAFNVIDVPEPGTIALFALGLAGFGAYEWRRRRTVPTPAAAPSTAA